MAKSEINPGMLKRRRKDTGLSQEDLATASGISRKTIARIEAGQSSVHATTIKRLSKALGCRLNDLSREPAESSDDFSVRYQFRPIKGKIDVYTGLAFKMVEHIYGISRYDQISMAPLFAALLAEGSLDWRRKKLEQINEAADALRSMGDGHFAFATAVLPVHEGAECERKSIDRRDLFREDELWDALYDLYSGYEPEESNPFTDYIKHLAGRFRSDAIEVDGDSAWSTRFRPSPMPRYTINAAELERLTGKDEWARFAVLYGHAKIRDIPAGLLGDDSSSERIAWLSEQVPQDEKDRYLAWKGELEASTGLPAPVSIGKGNDSDTKLKGGP